MSSKGVKVDPKLDQLLKKLDQQQKLTDLELHDIADAVVSWGQEDQAFEAHVFERGFDLAQRAGNNEVYYVDSYGSRYYFIGTIAGTIKRIEAAVDQL